MKKPTLRYLGDFWLGHEKVSLIFDPRTEGASFDLSADIKIHPKEHGLGRIVIGKDSWRLMVSFLVHEAFEYAACRLHVRFQYSGKQSYDSADYLFAFDHPRFARISTMVGEFMAGALPELGKCCPKRK
jgi:hypothetical protein